MRYSREACMGSFAARFASLLTLRSTLSPQADSALLLDDLHELRSDGQ